VDFSASSNLYKPRQACCSIPASTKGEGSFLSTGVLGYIAILWVVVAKFHTEKVWKNQIFNHL